MKTTIDTQRIRSQNFYKITLRNNQAVMEVWKSYSTPIAYNYVAVDDGADFQISKNEWSRTTARHLNQIDTNKDVRVDHDVFMEKLSGVLSKFGEVVV